MKRSCFALGALLWALGGVQSSLAAEATEGSVSALVSKVSNGKGRLLREFEAGPGLRGLVIEAQAGMRPIVAYADEKGRYLVVGSVFGANGAEIKPPAEVLAQIGSRSNKTDASAELTARRAIDALRKLAVVDTGSTGKSKEVWIVSEPNCGYCKQAFAALEPFQQRGDVRVHWVLVGYSEDGLRKASWVIQSDDPAQAIARTYTGQGARESVVDGRISLNTQVVSQLGISGTPSLIYEHRDGSVQRIDGFDFRQFGTLLANVKAP